MRAINLPYAPVMIFYRTAMYYIVEGIGTSLCTSGQRIFLYQLSA